MRTTLATVFAFAAVVCQAQFASPAPEIQKLSWMVGTWTSSGEFNVQGSAMDYTAEWTVSMEGPFIKTTNSQKLAGFELKETSYISWDPTKKEYLMTSYTNLSDQPRVEHGKWVGEELVFTSDPWMAMGQETLARATLKKMSDDEFAFKLEFKSPDGWAVVSSDPFKRKKG